MLPTSVRMVGGADWSAHRNTVMDTVCFLVPTFRVRLEISLPSRSFSTFSQVAARHLELERRCSAGSETVPV